MGTPGGIDRVLALLEHLDRYRRSWRCWLVGGPAAVDDIAIGACGHTVGVRLEADYEYETVDRVERTLIASQSRDQVWYDTPQPRPPAPGDFRNLEQTFPLADTRAYEWCARCWGRGRYRCPTCHGTGGAACPFCGGTGCPDCNERRGRLQCPDCEGRGTLRCTCSQERTSLDPLLHFEAARYTYTHERDTRDVLPDEARGRGLRRLLSTALRAAGGHVTHTANDPDQLARDVQRAHGLKEPPHFPSRLHRPAHLLERDSAPKGRQLLFQRLHAHVASLDFANVRLGDAAGRFWCAGTGDGWRCTLLGLERAVNRSLAALGSTLWLGLWTGFISTQILKRGYPEGAFAAVISLGAVAGYVLMLFASAQRSALRHLHRYYLRSLEGPAPMPEVAIIGPDAGVSHRFLSLFAHLASHAQLGDPSQGGALLNDDHAGLTQSLLGEVTAPEWSSAYRVRFGDGVPAGPVARLVHVVTPAQDAPDGLVRRTLKRAAQVWLVLPTEAREDADRQAAGIVSHLDGAQAVVVRDGHSADPLEGYPLAAAELAGRAHRGRTLPLEALRERYLTGGVSAGEAAELVRWLAAGPESPAQPPPEPSGEEESARHAVAAPVRVRPCSSVVSPAG